MLLLNCVVSEGSTTVALEDSTTGVEVEGPYEEAGDYTDSATQYDETANEQCEFEILCDAQSRFVTLDTTQFTTGSNATLRLPVLAPPGRRGPPGSSDFHPIHSPFSDLLPKISDVVDAVCRVINSCDVDLKDFCLVTGSLLACSSSEHFSYTFLND